MSVAFSAERRSNPSSQSVQSLLDENAQLIQAIVDYQNKGKAYESSQYQQLLHRNLVYLATLADSNQPSQGAQGPSSGGTPVPKPSVTPPSVHQQGPPPVSMIGSDVGTLPSNPNISSSSSDHMTPSSQSYPGNYGPGNIPGTPSPPQLQHPPASGPNVPMGYPSPNNPQVRASVPPVLSGPMPNVPQQTSMARHPGQIPPQHMMSQGQQSQQQYLMQQRQMQFRQAASQQVSSSQQSISSANQSTYPPQQTSAMMPNYQHQQQRYNPYRPPPQQQTLSHMPYPQQQGQMMMGQPQMVRGQMSIGQTSMGPGMAQTGHAAMVQSPMGQPPV